MCNAIIRGLAGLLLAWVACGCSDETRPTPVAPQPDKADAASGNNAIALDLYSQLRTQEGNLFFSPLSISTALAMTYAGARGETATEMAATLHFNLDQARLHAAEGALLHDMMPKDKKATYQLSIANALWAQKDYHFLPTFLRINKDNYGARLKEVDFIRTTEAARQTINLWVAKETRDKIQELLKKGVLDSDTRLVLTNAIYFKGDWNAKFKVERTKDAPFHLNTEKETSVPFMHQTGTFPYLHDKDFQALELPYAGKVLSMVVFLPKKDGSLAEFEKSLTSERLEGWLAELREIEVAVALPRFTATKAFSLKGALKAMGMHLAFVPDEADLSGINGQRDLFISAVEHKAFVDVNEAGTEAAAATADVVSKKSLGPSFCPDRPFFFLIRDHRSGSILFMGRLVDPRQ